MARSTYIEILLKSGQWLTFDATSLSTKRNPTTGDLTEISWEGAKNAPQYLQLKSVDMVRFVRP